MSEDEQVYEEGDEVRVCLPSDEATEESYDGEVGVVFEIYEDYKTDILRDGRHRWKYYLRFDDGGEMGFPLEYLEAVE